MVGVARIELATPAMSRQGFERFSAQNCAFSMFQSANATGTDAESHACLPHFYRTGGLMMSCCTNAPLPHRVQLSRRKGWRMPPNTVSVARPTKWGNPWSVKGTRAWLKTVGVQETYSDKARAANCAEQFERLLKVGIPCGTHYTPLRTFLLDHLHQLRGKNLACWCPLNRPCHADVLLELANVPICEAKLRREAALAKVAQIDESLGLYDDAQRIEARRSAQ